MQATVDAYERRTTADVVFDQLHDEIVSLKLLPGTKLSEAEVARRFGVSRQPVRDAFSRLGNLDLLLIRPQRATEIRGFSKARIGHARFIRLAIELEVVRQACAIWDDSRHAQLEENIALQQDAIDQSKPDLFHDLDYRFHKMICELGANPLAFATIEDCKHKIDRLCVLSLGRENESAYLLQDHRDLAAALADRNADAATAVTRRHLGRLDDTIAEIYREHSNYFE